MKNFSIVILVKIIILASCVAVGIYFGIKKDYFLLALGLLGATMAGFSIYNSVIETNRKLTLFFESIQYSDFSIKFSADNKLGASFKALNTEMNQVIDSFKMARAEKEANIQFLNTLLQHVDVGIVCYDTEERIQILNPAAMRLLGVYRMRELSEMKKSIHPDLYDKIKKLKSGEKTLYETSKKEQLAINATRVSLRGKAVKIVSIQNIRTELQKKEVDSWQNLTKVLRHEIMNSIAPIVSLTGTIRDIVDYDLEKNQASPEALADLYEALHTIENRGKGIMNFVNAYRDFTTLPEPIFKETSVDELFKHIEALKLSPKLTIEIKQNFELLADVDQFEMVLLNLIKNAHEAIANKPDGCINLTAQKQGNKKVISIKDNGQGIVAEALEKIFIPFYTTKKDGSGIGLSLSKQIINIHGGDIIVHSTTEQGTEFLLVFE